MQFRLRDYQEAAIAQFLAQPPPQRYFFAHEMGAGKSVTSIVAAQKLAARRVLIIVSALVRPNWGRELTQHWPDREQGLIQYGRTRTTLTKKQQADTERAYAAPIQVVSYDLLPQVDVAPWDCVIIDEIHNLRSGRSKQSKDVRRVLYANPAAAVLALSGTPIPNDAKQLFNPVDTLFPGRWGDPLKNGDPPWDWQARFCLREQTQYGTRFFGLRPERRELLAKDFSEISHRAVQADFAKYLPPLFVLPLHLDGKYSDKVPADWAAQLSEDITHFGVFTHLRETAHRLHTQLASAYPQHTVVCITGAESSGSRDARLQELRAASRGILVGTTHALKEGISLSFIRAALVVEWTTAVDQVLQFIGRFARQDSTTTAPTNVQFVVTPDDVSRSETLRQRIADINSVIKAGRTETLASGAFEERRLSETEYQRRLDIIITGAAKRSRLWVEDNDADDSEENDE